MKKRSQVALFPQIIETSLPPKLMEFQKKGQLEAHLKSYHMGDLSILVAFDATQGWHVSISHPKRYPVWDEIKHVRYELLPDKITMAMLLPPKDEYVNVHPNCFHLHQVGGAS